MIVRVHAFSHEFSRERVEALIDWLINLLDDTDNVSYDLEPDTDFEESDEGETETWPEWHPAGSIQIRRRGAARCALRILNSRAQVITMPSPPA